MCVICLFVQLDLRDCLIWRQFEHSVGKASSSSAEDMCGFLKKNHFYGVMAVQSLFVVRHLEISLLLLMSAENTGMLTFVSLKLRP